MELRTVDPRALRKNPHNPRRTSASPEADAMLEASIAAIGIILPPVVRRDDDGLMIVAGHRRITAAIAVGLTEIRVLLIEHADDGDDMRSFSENIARAERNLGDQWRAIEQLIDKDWTEPAIATALVLPVRIVQRLRLLGSVCPAILDYMACGDMPPEDHLRTIASAPQDEQVSVWKKYRPKKGETVAWYDLARALSKRRMTAKASHSADTLAVSLVRATQNGKTN
jgi:ParB family transcriptional regulator, chromosome partitioning protein